MGQITFIADAFYGSAWAITARKLREVEAVVTARAIGTVNPSEWRDARKEMAANGRSAGAANYFTVGRVAVIPIMGIIGQRMNLMMEMCGGTSTEILGRQIDAARDDNSIDTIVLDVDSPGGQVAGTMEAGRKILDARRSKRIIAVANGLMASAAYWLGSAAHEVVMTPSGQVGSIGVYMLHEDVSVLAANQGVKVTPIFAGKYKVDGNPYEPLSDTARTNLQSEVDWYYTQFVNAVARHRGTTPEAVRTGYGQGLCLTADAALGARLVDRVATLETVLAEANAGGRRGGSSAERFAMAKATQRQLEAEEELAAEFARRPF